MTPTISLGKFEERIREPQKLPAAPTTLYRSSGTLVANKPAGLAVHGDEDSVLSRFRNILSQPTPALSFLPGYCLDPSTRISGLTPTL